jgi:broad specificity phosphatase PhoE
MKAILVRHGETEYNATGLLPWKMITLNDIGHLETLA